MIVDSRQRVVAWNAAAHRLTGLAEHDVLGQHCYEVLGGRSPAGTLLCHVDCSLMNCVRRGQLPEDFDLVVRTRQGRHLYVNMSVIAVTQKRRGVTIHLFRDASRQRRLEEATGTIVRALGDAGLLNGARPAEPCPDGPPHAPPMVLTRRQLEVLRLLGEGPSTAAIANRLSISHFTARNHLQNILDRLELHTRAQLVSYVYHQHLL